LEFQIPKEFWYLEAYQIDIEESIELFCPSPFLVRLGFELRASHLQSGSSTASATPPVLKYILYMYIRRGVDELMF
jgi:hypothetical protein